MDFGTLSKHLLNYGTLSEYPNFGTLSEQPNFVGFLACWPWKWPRRSILTTDLKSMAVVSYVNMVFFTNTLVLTVFNVCCEETHNYNTCVAGGKKGH